MNKLLQNFNSAGISLFLQILGGDKSLALPHFSAQNISQVNWSTLKAAGFKGCVFDKDNTLCKPFALAVDPALLPSFEECIAAFDGNVVIFSNSAGLYQYDPDGLEAEALEKAFGVKVLRHAEKKPAGGCKELEELFGCPPSEMLMIGDRIFTDIVYGNRHGMGTVYVEPLTGEGEPATIGVARSVETFYLQRWSGRGLKAPAQPLLDALDAATREGVIRPLPPAEANASEEESAAPGGNKDAGETKSSEGDK